MATRKLDKEQWKTFFDRVSKMLEGKLRWSRLFGQFFRFDEWSLCRG
jgi:hypothetical protein